MPKGKKEKSEKKAKADKQGVKLPKAIRKAGEKAMELAREPMVSEIVAAALLSAAAALRDNKSPGRAAVAAGVEGLAAAGEAGKQASKVGDAMRGLALDLARRTLDNWERPSAGKSGGSKSGGAPKGSKKTGSTGAGKAGARGRSKGGAGA
jgi:hypothetical protein